MSTPPEQPRPHLHGDPPPSTPPRRALPLDPRLPLLVLSCSALLVLVLLIGLIFYVVSLLSPTAPAISAVDVSATAEAHTFATAQANRQATTISANATASAYALASTTAQARAHATALAYANVTATARAKATAEAPPTLTAQAKDFLEEQANAQATVQAIDPSAVQVYGPADGTLPHNTNDTPVCDDSGVQLTNFAAQARFYNPYPIDHDWDYGLVFTNPHDGSQYNVVLDADRNRSLRLQSPGYYVQLLDTTRLIDNSDTGSNLLKLYLIDGVAHLYINDRFETTVDLASLDFGNAPTQEAHDLKVCTGLIEGDMQPAKSTRYAAFTIWKLP